MRRIIILLGLLALLWMGWRLVDDSAPGDGAGDADTLAVLHRGNGPEPESLDPQIARSDSSGAILRDLFEGLTRLDPAGKVIAGAAASWDVSADGKTYTFHLRPAARWSNGDPLTAHDYVFSMRRLVDPETAAAFAFFLSPVINAPEIIAGDRPATALAAILERPKFGSQSQPVRFLLDPPDVSQLQIKPEQGSDGVGFGLVFDQLLVNGIVTQRHQPAHPHAPLFGGGNLVADALGRDLPLELGEGQQHIEGQPSHRRRGVELLGN